MGGEGIVYEWHQEWVGQDPPILDMLRFAVQHLHTSPQDRWTLEAAEERSWDQIIVPLHHSLLVHSDLLVRTTLLARTPPPLFNMTLTRIGSTKLVGTILNMPPQFRSSRKLSLMCPSTRFSFKNETPVWPALEVRSSHSFGSPVPLNLGSCGSCA